MPIYQIKCKSCGREESVFRRIADYNDLPDCCGERMFRKVCAPHVIADIQPYQSMIDGSMITSRSEHRRHLKANGCTEVGNESMEPKKDHFAEKKRHESLRQEISQRLEAI